LETLLRNKKIVFSVFIFLILFQAIYSFLFTGSNLFSPSWKNMKEMNFTKGYSYNSFDNSIAEIIYPLISKHRISSDAAAHVLLAYDFPNYFFKRQTYLDRPLYAFLINLISKPLRFISNSYSIVFAAGILLNLILLFFTVYFFYSLVKILISPRVAFLSSVLLIFSPIVHIWLVQPETEIFGLFVLTLGLFLLYIYIKQPSFKKLVVFSLLMGIVMLGKMVPAFSFFILILAVYFKRYKEGILFFLLHLIPFLLWYLFATQIWGIHPNSFATEPTAFKMFLTENWLLNIFSWPWQKTFRVFIDALPSFFFAVIYGFLLIPVIFAVAGFKNLNLEKKNIFCFGLIFSFFIMFFIMNYYAPRHGFLIFPVVLPLAVLGIDRTAQFLKKYKNWYSPVFYLAIFIFLIIIFSVNVFKIIDYGAGSAWLYR
jgi:4-amino-4-deoxy-L-arabinose transferase-like glycosyltransferase